MVKKLLFLILLFSFFFFPQNILAAPVVSITSFPSSVIAGDGFDVGFSASGLDPSIEYSMKALGGDELIDVDTWGSSWLQQNAAWSDMPVFTSDSVGSASATLKARFYPVTINGLKNLLVRIKTGSKDSIDSATVSVSVTAATPSPTPTTTPTPTPTPTATPIKTPTPTPIKSSIPTPKTTPSAAPSVASAEEGTSQPEVQGVQDARDSLNLLGTASGSAATTDSKGPPIIPIILISSGGIFVVGAGLALAKKGKSEYNLKDENANQTT